MKINKRILIVSIIIVSFLFLLPNVKGFDDIEYEFEKDVLFTDSNPELELFNLREQQVYNGTYEATFSFTNEPNGASDLDINFVDIIDIGGGTITIIDNIDGHSKIIELHDVLDGGGDDVKCINVFSSAIIGTVEFWLRATDTSTKRTNIVLRNEVDSNSVNIHMDQDKFQYNDGSVNDIGLEAIANQWYHIRLVFNCISDTYEIWINSIQYQNSVSFQNNADSLNSFGFFTRGIDKDYFSYLDGVGYSFGNQFNNDFNFDVSSETIDGLGITFDGTNYWISTFGNDIIAEYQINGVHTGTTYNISVNTPISLDLTFDGTFFYILDNDPSWQVDKYTNLGVYVSSFSIIAQAPAPTAITFDGTYLYILDNSDDKYSQYTIEGVFTGISIDVSNEVSNSLGLCFAGNSFFVIDGVLDTAFQYDLNGIYTGIGFGTTGAISPRTCTYNGTHISIMNIAFDNVHSFRYNFYTVGSNIAPILETLEGFEGLLETDKYEFSMLDVNLRSQLGDSDFGLWSSVEINNSDVIIISDDDNINLDRRINLELSANGLASIKRTSLGITENLIDVNFGFRIVGSGALNANFTVFLKASDESTITGYRIDESTNSLLYYNGDWNNVLRNDLALSGSDFFDINLFLNYDIDTVRLEYIKDNIFIENHIFEMVSTERTGLFEINATYEKTGAGTGITSIDYVGVYRDGESWHGELGIITLPIGLPFHFEKHYLYSINAKGRIHDGVVEGIYIVGDVNFQNITDDTTINRIYVSEVETFNIYENFISNIPNATLVYTVVGSDININSINIEGSKLTEGSNEHFLIFSSGGLESMDNYFYVSGNQLRFIHNTSIDDVQEFIQAEFNIDDKTSIDTAISFSSSITFDNAFGFFRVNFTDTSQILPIETSISRTKRVLLTTNEIITSFIILITDTNKNGIEGISEGQVSNIVLLDIETAIVSIVSSNLISMLIPVIIIILPTLAISGRYGDFLTVPLFIMFSLILTITGLIPIWLSFIIFISSSLFIFFDKDKRGIN